MVDPARSELPRRSWRAAPDAAFIRHQGGLLPVGVIARPGTSTRLPPYSHHAGGSLAETAKAHGQQPRGFLIPLVASLGDADLL